MSKLIIDKKIFKDISGCSKSDKIDHMMDRIMQQDSLSFSINPNEINDYDEIRKFLESSDFVSNVFLIVNSPKFYFGEKPFEIITIDFPMMDFPVLDMCCDDDKFFVFYYARFNSNIKRIRFCTAEGSFEGFPSVYRNRKIDEILKN